MFVLSDSKFSQYKKAPSVHQPSYQDPKLDYTDEEDELDLLYDQVLNCYYDPKTNKYYELCWGNKTVCIQQQEQTAELDLVLWTLLRKLISLDTTEADGWIGCSTMNSVEEVDQFEYNRSRRLNWI